MERDVPMTHDWRARLKELTQDRMLQIAAAFAVVATAAVAAPTDILPARRDDMAAALQQAVTVSMSAPAPLQLVWEGADIDGDGAADFANPTGKAPRTEDAYGSGAFGASRDGGSRDHEGVDFVADAGQAVVAPISGYVTKIGVAYAGAPELKFVEITNPALKYEARVFYVDPQVEVGDAVRIGRPIGRARTLQNRYAAGMTDHVHLEIQDRRGDRMDATRVITAQYVQAARG
jgi:murein DD-endopeptidase MepM/ murein hydrolase activator NlpD